MIQVKGTNGILLLVFNKLEDKNFSDLLEAGLEEPISLYFFYSCKSIDWK